MTLDIANLRKLLDAATPGPWHREWSDSHPDPANIEILAVSRADRVALIEEPDDASEVADADLIVALRNAAPELLDEVERLRDYDARLSAVMPPDFKDWHQNAKTEWPEIAAHVIENLRKREADAVAEIDRMRKIESDELREARDAILREGCEVETLRATLELVAGNLVVAQQKRADAPMSAETHIDEAIQAVQTYAPAGGSYSEAARKLRTELWSFASETRMEMDEARAELAELRAYRDRTLRLEREADRMRSTLFSEGFQRCDTAACNCGGWHQTGGYAARFREIDEAAGDHSGKTLLSAVKELVAYRDRTEAALLDLSTSARHMRERNLERDAIIAQLQMHGLWRDAKETP